MASGWCCTRGTAATRRSCCARTRATWRTARLVDAATLKPNMRVFVRAGKDLYDQVEAYQVIWGTILDPR